jgi:hypothetical protein
MSESKQATEPEDDPRMCWIKKQFIQRLMMAGWSKREATERWEEIENDEEGNQSGWQ